MLRIDNSALESSHPIDVGAGLHADQTVGELLQAWEDAKTEELTANQRRLGIEQQLAVLLPAPREGQKTYRIETWRVTRTNGCRYGGSVAKVTALADELELPCLTKPSLDEAAIKRLRTSHPLDFELLVDSGALTIKEAKPHFDVARVAAPELEQT